MSRMLYLTDVFQLIIYGLNNRAFAQKNLISHRHEYVFHVVLYACNQVDAIVKKIFKKPL